MFHLTPTTRPHTPHRDERRNLLPLFDVTTMSLAAKSPFSPSSISLGRTSAAPICNLFSQVEHLHCQSQGTSIAKFRLCNEHATAGVPPNGRVSPAQARSHHFTAVAYQIGLHGQAAVNRSSTLYTHKGWKVILHDGHTRRMPKGDQHLSP